MVWNGKLFFVEESSFRGMFAVGSYFRDFRLGGREDQAWKKPAVKSRSPHDRLTWLGVRETVRPYLRWVYYQAFPTRRPEYFKQCWKQPWSELKTDNRSLPESFRSPGALPDVLFFPMCDWHTRTQRSQQMARLLAGRGHRCVYFNPHLGLEYILPYALEKESRIAELHPRILEAHVHLPREHAYHRRLLTQDETERVYGAAHRLIAAASIYTAVQMVSLPIWLDAALALRRDFGFPIVYDCHDHLAGFENISGEIVARERDLLREADMVVFSSQRLQEVVTARCPEIATRSVMVRNAGAKWPERPAAARPAGSRPRAGYVGSLDHWFDVDLLDHAAGQLPQVEFQLVGRVEHARVHRLRRHRNVQFTGEVRHEALPEYLSQLDLALIPFALNELTRATNPIKLYEYFSFGLPVVSTRLPEVERYGDLVYIADTPSQFSQQINRALSEDAAPLRARRQAVLEDENWPRRAAEMQDAISRLVSPSGSRISA